MSQRPIRVLIIEDAESDYLLTRRMLSAIEGQVFDLEWASNWQAGITAVRQSDYDVCLLDYRIDGGDGLELLKESRQTGCRAPVILLTGVADRRLDVEAMQLGAADFLVKDQLNPALLERSIRYAIEEARVRRELQRQQDELRASELRFRSVVQSASDAIIIADQNARIISWNRGAENIFGYSEQEVVGEPLELLMPESYRDRHRAGFERYRGSGKSHIVGKTVELEGLRKDGTVFPLELSLASWTTGEGTFFTGILRDTTERKRAEEMRRAKDAAEEANRAKSDFLARMSHELRTPLHAIIGFTNILLENKARNLNANDVDFLQRIHLNAGDQLRLINTILDLSKIEAGQFEVALEPVAVEHIINDIVKQIEGERRTGEVNLIVQLPDSAKAIVTDAAKLKQVLINIVHNALKFTERGSVTIRLTTDATQVPVRIDVIDTGPGIPPGRMNEIFEPFQQLESEKDSGTSGTGLGLSICRSLCDLMGYSIRVQSQPGLGATFSIVLEDANRMPLSA